MDDPNDMTWLDQMLNKYANYTKAINESASNTKQNASSTKVSRWSPQDSATNARQRVSRWSSQATAAYAAPQHNSSQMQVAPGNNYELDELDAIAPPPPSWPTNEKEKQNTPTFTNSNEAWLRITEVRGSVNQPTPNLTESVVSSMKQAKKRPIIQQWLANNDINEQKQLPDQASKPRREERQRNTTANSLTKTQTSLSVSIASNDYPTTKLTKRQMDCIQQAILNTIIAQSDKIKVKPRFHKFHYNVGYVTLDCEDKATADWTKTIIPKLAPWGGVLLTAVDGDPFKLTTFLRCVFPNAKLNENEQILNLIKAQNDGLTVNKWRLIKRVDLNNHNVMLLYAIDQQSADQLEKVNGKIAFRFESLHAALKPLGDPRLMEHNDKKRVFDETKKKPAKRSFDETKKPPAKQLEDDSGKGSSLRNSYWL